MHINESRESVHRQIHRISREGDNNGHHNNSVALEIGKDFRLPDSSIMSTSANSCDLTEMFSDTSSPVGPDSQSQLHPSDEENGYILLRRREKNRKAAQKCREKKKEKIRDLENTVKDLNNDLRLLKCRNDKLEKEKAHLLQLLTAHKHYCSLKVESEDDSTDTYLVEKDHFKHSPDHVPRIPQHIHREVPNMPTSFSSYMYQRENFVTL